MKIDILFEDEYLLAVNKPSGLITHGTVDQKRANLYDELKKQTNLKLYLHHRLDKDTSGVTLFAKDESVNSTLTNMFKEHLFTKNYLAVAMTNKSIVPKLIINNYLKEKKIKNFSTMVEVKSGGLKAITTIEKLCEKENKSLYLATPQTGRMHQIRVHMAGAGIPIIGDSLYGKALPHGPSLLLHAYSLEFQHPKDHKIMKIIAPIPERFLPFTPEDVTL